MCLAIPSKIIKIDGNIAEVDIGGNIKEINILLTPEAKVGDYVLSPLRKAWTDQQKPPFALPSAVFPRWSLPFYGAFLNIHSVL